MRYVGRHRAPRPLFLRRPVLAGVGVAVLMGGPAVAVIHTLVDDRPDLTAATQGNLDTQTSSPSATSGLIVIPTDDVPVPPTDLSTSPLTQTTGRPLVQDDDGGGTSRRRSGDGNSDDESEGSGGSGGSRPTTTKPTRTTTTTTTTKPPPPPEETTDPPTPTPTDPPTSDEPPEEPLLPVVP